MSGPPKNVIEFVDTTANHETGRFVKVRETWIDGHKIELAGEPIILGYENTDDIVTVMIEIPPQNLFVTRREVFVEGVQVAVQKDSISYSEGDDGIIANLLLQPDSVHLHRTGNSTKEEGE